MSNSEIAQSAIVPVAGVAVLPFTAGNQTVSYIVLVAIVCATIVLVFKIVKRIVVRG
jgi:hypothetical protein